MKRLLSALLALALLLATGCASANSPGEMVVGDDIAFEELTDFYYTYDASTAPPHYQRYRFYVQDGKHYFYHETREGGGWPQTEENITRSGTVALTDAQWMAFCNLLRGGTASRREENLNDGDAGPYLYIYWVGGEEEGREFSFASYAEETEFEEFCAALG